MGLYGYSSTLFLTPSGIRQGSNLEPLLLQVLVYNLLHIFRSKCLAYADDIKMFSVVININDCHVLQNALSVINACCVLDGVKYSKMPGLIFLTSYQY